MKVTRKFIKNLIKEAKGDDSCPSATQDKDLNSKNKMLAADNPAANALNLQGADTATVPSGQQKLCRNCAAFDITPQMVDCGGANEEGTAGYCKMHDFSCAAEKTCLTWAPGGPKK